HRDPDNGRYFQPGARVRDKRQIALSIRVRAVSARIACVPYETILTYSSTKRNCIFKSNLLQSVRTLGTAAPTTVETAKNRRKAFPLTKIRFGFRLDSTKS